MEEIKDYYFKWSEHGQLASGIKPRPAYEHVRFVECEFHPNVWPMVTFTDCVFVDCDIWDGDLAVNPANLGNKTVYKNQPDLE